MSEYRRTFKHQFCDAETVIIIDKHTGEMSRFGEKHAATGTLSDALDYLEKYVVGTRYMILKLNCIVGYEL